MALNILGNAYVAVHAITTGFKSDVNDAVDDIKRNSKQSSMFSGMFSGMNKDLSRFQQEALRANKQFTRMVQVGYALGPAIAFLVGGISSLVSGFVALAAQVGVAVPSLIVLPGILMAIGQAAMVAMVAFRGIGAGLKQLSRGGRGGAGRGDQVEQAEANLARVLESNREALARASENLADAEERLTDARKEAAESLQQLNFDAEDAALSEKRASIALEQARERLARIQDLPPNSRARREAELAYAEADLNLRRAKDRNADLAKETEEANRKGVEGSEQVVDATEAVQDAVDAKAKTERDALRQQLDAEKALARAKSGGGGGGGEDAMAKLSKEAQDFVKYLFSIRNAFAGLRAAAGKDLFPQLTVAIQQLVSKLLPALIPMFGKMGKALGGVAVRISDVVTESSNLRELGRISDTNTYVVEALGKVFANLYDILLSVFDAAGPLIRRFADWLVVLTDGWKATREARNQTGELGETFKKAGDAAAQIGRIFGNIGGALMNIGRAASGPGSGGQALMDAFEGATQKFEEFTQKLLDNGRLRQFFLDVAENTTAIMSMLTALIAEFLRLGDNPALATTATSLRDNFLPVVRQIFDTLAEAGPYLSDFIGKLAALIQKFTETGSIEMFFKVLGMAVDVLNAVFGNPIVAKILMVVAPIMGIVKAFSLMASVGGFAFKVIVGYGVKLAKFAKIIKAVGLAIKAAFIANPIGAVIAAIIAIIAIVVIMYKKFKWFRDFVHAVWDGILGAIKWVWNWVKDNWPTLIMILTGPIGIAVGMIIKHWDKITGALKAAWDFVVETVGKVINFFVELPGKIAGAFADGFSWLKEKATALVSWIGQKVIDIVQFFIGLPGRIVTAFGNGFNWLWTKAGEIKDKVVEKLGEVVTWVSGLPKKLLDAFVNAGSFLLDIGKKIVDLIIEGIKSGANIADALLSKIPGWGIVKKGAGALIGKGWLWANGGIATKPILRVIGEDGPEAVIPLTRPRRAAEIMQAAGLSSAGGLGGNMTINVYPSPGMDEAALARAVSRQLAFQLRKGGT